MEKIIKNYKKINIKGITMVEMLLYMAILSLIILAVSSMIFLTFQSRIKGQVMAEVEGQGAQTMRIILQIIRNSDGINNPSAGTSLDLISINTFLAGTTPTVFDINGGKIRIKEGTNANIDIVSNRLTASNLVFRNLSWPNTPGSVGVEFTLSYNNPNNIGSFNYSKTFYGTTSLRWP